MEYGLQDSSWVYTQFEWVWNFFKCLDMNINFFTNKFKQVWTDF